MDTISAIQSSMLNDVERLTTLSQNIANANTAGYKKQITINRSFFEELAYASNPATEGEQLSMLTAGVPYLATVTDQSSGAMKYTGSPFDLATVDNTYLKVLTPNGIAFTKQGSFSKNAEGVLVNAMGHPLLSESGDIRITGNQPIIDSKGNVYDGEKLVATIQTATFAPETKFTSIGFGLYTAAEDATVKEAPATVIKQGYLEMANVTAMEEMVKLIGVMRHFEASQKLMQGYDAMLDNAINIIGDVK